MKKISLIILAAFLAVSMVACATEQQDLTSISDYIPAPTTMQIETGTLHFADSTGDSSIITDYVGSYTEHVINVPEKTESGRVFVGIGNEAFYSCTVATEIILPETITFIGDWAFAGCEKLETIVIPASVTSIGKGAFNGCAALKSIVFMGNEIKSIGDYAFNGCSALESITLPEGLESIGTYAFNMCSSITSIKAPSTLKTIGNMAFCDCEGLNAEGALVLSSSITEIGEFAFSGINKDYISAPEGSYAADYVAEMRELDEKETETE